MIDGRMEPEAVWLNTSAVPSRNSASRTTAMVTECVRIARTSTPSTTTRASSTTAVSLPR
jgi:hypothetical protein